MEEKMGLFGILKESLKILFKNPNFIILAFFSSLPLFCFLIMYETTFQQTMVKTGKIFLQENAAPSGVFIYYYETIEAMMELVEQISSKFVLLCLLYFCMLHLLDLLNMIVIVDVASLIYKGKRPMTLGNMLSRCIKETRFKGPLITSVYVLLLDSLISLGLLSLAMYLYLTSSNAFSTVFLVFFVVFLSLLSKYIEWSAVWNMGILISVLEDKHGDVPLVISSYLSRGSWPYGFLLMLVFYTWRLVLRLACLYVGWDRGGSGVAITTVQVSLVCLAKVWLWLTFIVYFYDCKKQSSQKNTDVEEKAQSSIEVTGDLNAAKAYNPASIDI